MTDWSEIVRECGPLVWRTAWRLLGCEADAADCFQKTFMEAIQLSRRETVRSWPALLQRLATSRALDQLRVRRRHRDRSEPAALVSELAGQNPGPSQQAETAELVERLRYALAELPARQAEAFCLCSVDGLSYSEAGQTLGLDAGGVGALLHRARKELRRRLASWEPGVRVQSGGES